MQLDITWQVALLTIAATITALTTVIVLTRINGLRSFAKMAPHDFAATIAIGSLLASTAIGSVPVAQGLVALAALYATQRSYQWWREHGGEPYVDNTPLLLMAGPRVLWENMARGGITESDLCGKLREANVLRYDQVLAVVLESTGDIAVLHGDGPDDRLELDLLEGVRGLPEAAARPRSWSQGARLRGTDPGSGHREP